jgi:hypothetical protein
MLWSGTVMGTYRDLIRTAGRFRTTSVIAPLYYPLIILGIFASIVTPFAGVDHSLTWMLWIAFVAVGGWILLSYTFWSFKNPVALQTEEYRTQLMRLIGDESRPGAGAVLIDSAPLTSNTGPTK